MLHGKSKIKAKKGKKEDKKVRKKEEKKVKNDLILSLKFMKIIEDFLLNTIIQQL